MSSKPSVNPHIGVLGLGRMGRAMAARLAQRGFEVAGWTRSGIASEPAREWRIAAHASVDDMVAASDIVLLSLSDDAAVIEIVGQLVRGDLAGKLIVDTSTVSPDTLRRLAGAIGEAGGAAMDAPISGGPDLILAGKAGFYIGGAAADFERFRPVAEAMSNRVHHVGALGEGAAAKIVNNMLLLGFWGCLKEAVQVGKRAGLSAETMMRFLSGSPAATPLLAQRVPVILGQGDDVGFTIAGVVKDGVMFTRTAGQYGVPVPAIEAALASYRACEEAGLGEADFAVMIRAAYRDA
ncbi:MAG TPA: NAD(P)-dependent oxidoreductase [Dongiaceae bacterium]|nr:NAD(P)-dependent oxidoreductase [Dongiaceae bacterium]